MWIEHCPKEATDGTSETFELVVFSSYQITPQPLLRRGGKGPVGSLPGILPNFLDQGATLKIRNRLSLHSTPSYQMTPESHASSGREAEHSRSGMCRYMSRSLALSTGRRASGGRTAQALHESEGTFHRQRPLNRCAGRHLHCPGCSAKRSAGPSATEDGPEGHAEILRLLSERREDLVCERTRALNRLHVLLWNLLSDPVGKQLSTNAADKLLRRARPQHPAGQVRRRLASEVMRDVRALDRRIAELDKRIAAEVEASGTTLTEICIHAKLQNARA